MIVILKINMFINSIYKTFDFQNSHACLKVFTCFHHYPEIDVLFEISKHFKFTETHAGFYLGFFCWEEGEVDPERIF